MRICIAWFSGLLMLLSVLFVDTFRLSDVDFQEIILDRNVSFGWDAAQDLATSFAQSGYVFGVYNLALVLVVDMCVFFFLIPHRSVSLKLLRCGGIDLYLIHSFSFRYLHMARQGVCLSLHYLTIVLSVSSFGKFLYLLTIVWSYTEASLYAIDLFVLTSNMAALQAFLNCGVSTAAMLISLVC